MTTFELAATLITLAGVFSWVNHRWVRLPTTIGLLVIAMVSSLALVALHAVGVFEGAEVLPLIRGLDFQEVLLDGMLGALLFAGAIHLRVADLLEYKWAILMLATGSVVLSTLIVGAAAYGVFAALGLPVTFMECLLFGALISPTDPVAVGAILRRAGVPRSLDLKLSGESLFNDGFGVVVFLVVLALSRSGEPVTASHVAALFAEEVLGGIAYGIVVGYALYRMLKSVDHYQVEILLTLAFVTGGYALAQRMHVSGPLAMVVAGLMVGGVGREYAMSDVTQQRLDSFWELVDDFLNAMLFVLIGAEVVVLEFAPRALAAGFLMIPICLGARFVSVGVPVSILRVLRQAVSRRAVTLLTWSGLRGGISVALALSLPAGGAHDLLVTATYVVVAFSIIVQGLTVGPLAKRLLGEEATREAPAAH